MMIKLIKYVVLIMLCASASAAPIITDFKSNININKDASVIVTENITAKTDGKIIQHGLVRDLKTVYRDPNGNVGYYVADILSAAINGKKSEFHTQRIKEGIKIYIGNEGQTLPAGTYTFTIRYKLNDVIRFFGDHDELYFNVTGLQWQFPVEHAAATVTVPTGTVDPITRYTAYTGKAGARGQAYTAEVTNPNTVHFTSDKALNPGQGLTIVVAMKKGIIIPPAATKQLFGMLSPHQMLIYAIMAVIILLAYYLVMWYRNGRSPVMGAIIPEYTPPKGFTPAAIRYINDMGYDAKVLTAAILNLAVKGYINIAPAKKNGYQLTKSEGEVALTQAEQVLFSKLFLEGDTLNLSKTSTGRIVRNAENYYKKQLRSEFLKTFFKKNSVLFYVGVAITAILSLPMLNTYSMLNGHGSVYSSHNLLTVIIVFAGAAAIVENSNVILGLKEKILSIKLSLRNIIVYGVMFMIFFTLAKGLIHEISGSQIAEIMFVAMLALAIINLFFAYFIKQPTAQGIELMRHARGFKLFLEATEKQQMDFRNPPDKTPELFEVYLPYALALDVEQKWSEKFSQILQNSQYTPSWYSSGASTPFYLMSANAFTSALSSSIASNSSSGFSGGSSGGGSGGGGGGGW